MPKDKLVIAGQVFKWVIIISAVLFLILVFGGAYIKHNKTLSEETLDIIIKVVGTIIYIGLLASLVACIVLLIYHVFFPKERDLKEVDDGGGYY